VCPWNKFAKRSVLPDFEQRHGLEAASLLHLLSWSEKDFLHYTEGSAIRRIGHVRWLRNLAVAAGNALRQADKEAWVPHLLQALQAWQNHDNPIVCEHIDWALTQNAALCNPSRMS
jgi:epoxyqueuosine reductase